MYIILMMEIGKALLYYKSEKVREVLPLLLLSLV